MRFELNKIHNVDARVLLGAMESGSVGLLLTDPPFGQALGYGRGQLGERYIDGDDDLTWLPEIAAEMWRVLADNKSLLMFCQWRTYSEFERELKRVGFTVRTVAIWDKGNAGLSGGGFAEQYEQIIVCRKGEARETRYSGNVFNYPRLTGRPIHPHEKPLRLIKKLIDLTSVETDLVCDPFAGSGTTCVAAEKLGRMWVASEIDEHHFRNAERRIECERTQRVLDFVA